MNVHTCVVISGKQAMQAYKIIKDSSKKVEANRQKREERRRLVSGK